nr:antitoxin [Pyrobaculum arsenaticum]
MGIDYAREIREYLQRRVKEEKAKKLAEALDKLIEQAIEKDYSTTWIREERESRS